MRPDDVERAVDALISRVRVPAVDAGSIVARSHERIVRRRVVLSGVSFALLATIATAGAVANSHHTTIVAAPRPGPTTSPTSTTTTTLPADAGPQFVQIKAVSALEAWKCLDPLQYTDDGGRTWRDLEPPANVMHDAKGNPPVCTAVAGGNAWSALTTHDPPPSEILRVRRGTTNEVFPFPRASAALSQLAELTFFDANYGWVLIVHGTSELENLYRTLDGGRTWFLVAHNRPIGYGQVFTSARRGWARNSDNLLTTSDGGATWRAVELPAAPNIAGFEPQLYGVVAHGRSVVVSRGIYNGDFLQPFFDVSSDDGRTWSQRPGPEIPADAGSPFDAPDALHLRLFSNGMLWISDDGGRTWAQSPGGPSATYVESMSFPTADVGWILGNRLGRSSPIVFRTTDAGRTWIDVTNGPGGIVGCPTRPLTPAPAGDPPSGVVSAAIAHEKATASNVTAVYRVGYVGAGAFGNIFRDNVTSCGAAVARASWVVEFGDHAVVLAHYSDGWHVFGPHH